MHPGKPAKADGPGIASRIINICPEMCASLGKAGFYCLLRALTIVGLSAVDFDVVLRIVCSRRNNGCAALLYRAHCRHRLLLDDSEHFASDESTERANNNPVKKEDDSSFSIGGLNPGFRANSAAVSFLRYREVPANLNKPGSPNCLKLRLVGEGHGFSARTSNASHYKFQVGFCYDSKQSAFAHDGIQSHPVCGHPPEGEQKSGYPGRSKIQMPDKWIYLFGLPGYKY